MIKKHVIAQINQDSIGEELGIEIGDILLEINGQPIEDALDYHLLVADEYIEVLIEKHDTYEQWLLEIDKEEDETLGLVFESELMDVYKSCNNKCLFCFIDQLPQGMRSTLYFKDDDARLSFLQGNYVTLTNMKDADVDRIIKYRLQPINISIHTMDMALRKKMLNNRFADQIKKHMDKLNEHGIIMNGQIVLCKGVNDGQSLYDTIAALEPYVPNLQSLSIVPVGLSRYRKGLYPLEPFEREDAINLIDMVTAWQGIFMDKHDTHFVHLSDEFYLLAERPLPEEENYDQYLQLENGVGMSRLFTNQFREALKTGTDKPLSGAIDIVTGMLFYRNLEELINEFLEKYADYNDKIQITIHPITNEFFGKRITVSGLLTGQDIINQLKHKNLSGELVMPRNLLKSEEDILLDDITVDDIQKTLGIHVNIVETDGGDFYQHLIDLLKV